MDGPHAFNSLLLTNAAVLTHSPCAATVTHKLDLTVSNAMVVATDSRIDVSGKGYLPERTTGNSGVGAAHCYGGGSYGGLGGLGNNNIGCAASSASIVYGDYADPEDWGSGGSSSSSASGGGLLRVHAHSLVLDGQMRADGGDGSVSAGAGIYGNGGGSGGGIYVDVGVLAGSGLIRAGGGAGAGGDSSYPYYSGQWGGGGGGGRVAVYAQDYGSFNLAQITTPGGAGSGNNSQPGGAGTVYLLQGVPHTHARFTVPGKILLFPTNSYTLFTTSLTNGLAIQFNNPINTNSFSSKKLVIQGPLGQVVPTGISHAGDRLYQIAFPPQSENGSYQFTLLPTLLDSEGFQLDQNANGIPGEPSDAYNFTLILDTVPPRAVQHSPAGDVAGIVDHVDVWFTEVLDTNSFAPSRVVITNQESGQAVSASSIQYLTRNIWRISFPPQTTVGTYHVLLDTNITDLAGNPLFATYDAWFNLVPVHLLLSDVAFSTNQFWSGDQVSISWNGRNESGAPLLGNWADGVFLSQDDRWDINDILITTIPHTNGLASNELYSASVSVFVPGALPGNYHIIIRSDVFMQERSPTNQPNNFVAMPIQVTMPELTLGMPYSDQFLASKRARYYRVTVPDSADLRVTLDLAAATGATELYISYTNIPSRSQFDVKYSAPFQPDHVVRVPGTQAGIYYLLAYADTLASTPAPFTLLTELLPFALTGLTPNHGGNGGNVTLRLTGSGIPTNSTAKLVYLGSNGVPVEVVAIRSIRQDMGTMLATFDLHGISPSLADVVLNGEVGQSNVLGNAFRIEVGQAPSVVLDATGPNSVRPGGGPGNYQLRVRNDANQDAELVLLSARIQDNPSLSLTVEGALPFGKTLGAESGVVSYVLPKILVGETALAKYQLVVSGSFSGSGMAMTWQAGLLDRAAYVTQLGSSLETNRLQTLANTNLQTESPELYALALDPVAWLQHAAANLQKQGFDFSAAELTPGTPLVQNQTSPRSLAAKSANGSNCKFMYKGKRCEKVIIYIDCGGVSPPWGPLSWCNNIWGCQWWDVWELECDDCQVSQSTGSAVGVGVCTPRPRDPNLITGPRGFGTAHFISRDTLLPYLVEFENQPAAQGAAVQVTITNQLRPELDWQTFALTEIGFAGVKLAVPDGLSHFETRVPFAGWTWNSTNGWHRGQTPLMVDVKAGLDINTGLISLTLTCSDHGSYKCAGFSRSLQPHHAAGITPGLHEQGERHASWRVGVQPRGGRPGRCHRGPD